MSLNNIPDKLPSVEKLISRVTAAEKSQQREIRITLQEAKELINDLAIITAKTAKNVQEIHQILLDIKKSTTQIDIKFDGGSFN